MNDGEESILVEIFNLIDSTLTEEEKMRSECPNCHFQTFIKHKGFEKCDECGYTKEVKDMSTKVLKRDINFDELVAKLKEIKDPNNANFYVAVNPNKFVTNSLVKYYAKLIHCHFNEEKEVLIIIAQVTPEKDVIYYSTNDKPHIGIGNIYYYPKFSLGVADMYDSIKGALKIGKRLFIEVVRE